MVPRGDNWTNWRTLSGELRAKEARSGLAVLITSGFYFAATSCRSAFEKVEHSGRSVFLMHCEKAFSVPLVLALHRGTCRRSCSGWNASSSTPSLGNYSGVREWLRAENDDAQGGKYRHLTSSLLMKLHPGGWRWCWQCTRCSQGDRHVYIHY